MLLGVDECLKDSLHVVVGSLVLGCREVVIQAEFEVQSEVLCHWPACVEALSTFQTIWNIALARVYEHSVIHNKILMSDRDKPFIKIQVMYNP